MASEEITAGRLYSWNFLSETSQFPMIHLVQPFVFYFIIQDWRYVVMIFTIWEMVEILTLTICGGSYCLWGGGPLDLKGLEGGSGSMGDVIQGVIGLTTGILHRKIMNIPSWTESIKSSRKKGILGIWFKRFFWLLLVFPIPQLTSVGQRTSILGILLYQTAYIIIFIIFGFWNHRRKELETFWRDSLQRKRYSRIYISQLFITLFLISAAFLPFPNMYINVWIQTIIIWSVYLAVGFYYGDWAKILNLFTCGIVDCYGADEKTQN